MSPIVVVFESHIPVPLVVRHNTGACTGASWASRVVFPHHVWDAPRVVQSHECGGGGGVISFYFASHTLPALIRWSGSPGSARCGAAADHASEGKRRTGAVELECLCWDREGVMYSHTPGTRT